MSQPTGQPASTVYAVETFKAPFLKRWASTIASVAVAIVTLGGTATPVISKGYRITERSSGRVVGEVSDTMLENGSTESVLRGDLATMSADEFADQWL